MTARVSETIRRLVDERSIPGALVLVAEHGRVVHLEAQGMMDSAPDRPFPTDSVIEAAVAREYA